MYYLVAYDIISDRQRKKVSDYLESIGERVNKSVFICCYFNDDKEILVQKLQSYLNKGDDVLIVPLCKKCFDSSILLNRDGTTKRQNLTTFV